MTEAAVGFQCPECVAAGRADVREARTPFGGAIDTRASVTLSLIGICVVIFGLEYVAGVNQVLGDYGSWPFGIAVEGQPWRLFTAMFLHVNLLHLLFNMYVLYLIGPQLERLFGHVRYLVLYLVAGLGGSVASFWFSDPHSVSAGASGAIFGLMAALVVAGHAVKADVTQVLVLIGINLAIGFLVGGIDWRAHLGGLVTATPRSASRISSSISLTSRNGSTEIVSCGCGTTRRETRARRAAARPRCGTPRRRPATPPSAPPPCRRTRPSPARVLRAEQRRQLVETSSGTREMPTFASAFPRVRVASRALVISWKSVVCRTRGDQ